MISGVLNIINICARLSLLISFEFWGMVLLGYLFVGGNGREEEGEMIGLIWGRRGREEGR